MHKRHHFTLSRVDSDDSISYKYLVPVTESQEKMMNAQTNFRKPANKRIKVGSKTLQVPRDSSEKKRHPLPAVEPHKRHMVSKLGDDMILLLDQDRLNPEKMPDNQPRLKQSTSRAAIKHNHQ